MRFDKPCFACTETNLLPRVVIYLGGKKIERLLLSSCKVLSSWTRYCLKWHGMTFDRNSIKCSLYISQKEVLIITTTSSILCNRDGSLKKIKKKNILSLVRSGVTNRELLTFPLHTAVILFVFRFTLHFMYLFDFKWFLVYRLINACSTMRYSDARKTNTQFWINGTFNLCVCITLPEFYRASKKAFWFFFLPESDM